MVFIAKNRFKKTILILMIFLVLIMPFQNLTIKKADAVAPAIAAFLSLTAVAMGAYASYQIVENVDITYSQATDLYNRFRSGLTPQNQALFDNALIQYDGTGIITTDYLDDLQLGKLAYFGYQEYISPYQNVLSTHSASSYNLIDSYIFDVGTYNLFDYNYLALNDRYLMGYSVSHNSLNYVSDISINKIDTSFSSADKLSIDYKSQVYVSSSIGPYTTSFIKNKFILIDTYNDNFIIDSQESDHYFNNKSMGLKDFTYAYYNYDLNGDLILSTGTIFPWKTGIEDLQEMEQNIPVPIDVAISKPNVPVDASDDTIISFPLNPDYPVGGTIVDVPVTTIDTDIPDTGIYDPAIPIDPSLPGIGALNPTLPTGSIPLNFEPLTNTGIFSKFPFCIPTDMLSILNIFDGTSRTPLEFSLPFVLGMTLDFDLSHFSSVASMTRFFLFLIFLWGLMLLTKKILF